MKSLRWQCCFVAIGLLLAMMIGVSANVRAATLVL